jgi:hypothetical protein
MSGRGRPFQPGNTLGRGRPRGSPNKKSLVLQEMLLDQGEKIIQSAIDRAKKGDRTALALCVERLIPRLKDVAELPVEQPREDPQSTTNQAVPDLSALTRDELNVLDGLLAKAEAAAAAKAEAAHSGSDRSRAPVPKAA